MVYRVTAHTYSPLSLSPPPLYPLPPPPPLSYFSPPPPPPLPLPFYIHLLYVFATSTNCVLSQQKRVKLSSYLQVVEDERGVQVKVGHAGSSVAEAASSQVDVMHTG